MKVYFQIGTNNGNDLFNKKVRNDKPDLVILVEPNAELEPVIRKNYEGVPNVFIFSKAIYYEDDSELTLYIPAKKGVFGSRADNGLVYENAHFSLMPMNDWGSKEDMVKLKTQSIKFDSLCQIFGLKHIDYLQMDTEGFDSEIIKIIDLSKIDIKQIRYEIWNFDPEVFTKYHNDKAAHLGKNGMREAEMKLNSAGYTLKIVHDEDGNDIIAIKN
jgi:FkbM family methyltransferase